MHTVTGQRTHWTRELQREIAHLRSEAADVLKLHRNPNDEAHKVAVRRLHELDEWTLRVSKAARDDATQPFALPRFTPVADVLEPLAHASTVRPTLPLDHRAAAAGEKPDADEPQGEIEFGHLTYGQDESEGGAR